MVRARLERHVDRRTARLLSRVRECGDLGVRPALLLVPTLADDLAAGDHDRAHDRIRVSRPPPPLGELEGVLHELGGHGLDPRRPKRP